jgi:Uma2 family endonuclease
MSLLTLTKPFAPGTTGWTADDLLQPEIERQWDTHPYEIIEGVLTIMPAAYLSGGKALFNLLYLLRSHEHAQGKFVTIATEIDVVLSPRRVVRPDGVLLTPEDEARQVVASRHARKPRHGNVRILVPPTLIVESISIEHEAHDRETKRGWYAEAGVPNYWLLDAYQKTLECLVLKDGVYNVDASGRDDDHLSPSAFPGLAIALADVWR